MARSFTATIISLRKKRGLSQKQAAAELAITPGMLSHYERGIRECGLDFLLRLADYYGVSVDYLLGRPENSPAAEPEPHSLSLLSDTMKLLYKISEQSGIPEIAEQLDRFFAVAAYRYFRTFVPETHDNQDVFKIEPEVYHKLSCLSMKLSEMATKYAVGIDTANVSPRQKKVQKAFSKTFLTEQYPDLTRSLCDLIIFAEDCLTEE